jgi:hypothetical protein
MKFAIALVLIWLFSRRRTQWGGAVVGAQEEKPANYSRTLFK